MDLRVLLLVPLSIEMVLPEWTCCGVHLMFASTIRTLEWVQAQFAFLDFEMWWISFFVGLTTPAEFTMVLWFVGFIALNTLWTSDPIWKSRVILSSAVFTLCDSRVHISSPNCHNVPSDVEALIDETFVLWDTWTLTIFIFLFFYFSDFILFFFFFFFSFEQ